MEDKKDCALSKLISNELEHSNQYSLKALGYKRDLICVILSV